KADVPEDDRDREISEDRPDVPFKRTAKLRPHAHGGRIRKHPVHEPRPSEMEDRIDTRTDHGEKRHGLGEAIERVAPFAAKQQQKSGNQRAGMTDAQPPDIVMNCEGPVDWNVKAPDADAPREPDRRGDKQKPEKQGRNKK